jgi:hypothetical protein
VIVSESCVYVRESASTTAKRRPSVMKVVGVVEAHSAVARAIAPVPRVIPVAGTARQPADVTETKSESKTDSEANAASESEE